MKHYEVGYNLSGSIVVPAERIEDVKDQVKNSDCTSSYELFHGVALNFIDAGNDAITINDIREYDAPPTERIYELIQFTLSRVSVQSTETKIVSYLEGERESTLNVFFNRYWGEENTKCVEPGSLYNHINHLEAIQVNKNHVISEFEAEILLRYL
ncbi:hypothetical protein QTG56_24850 (plasmid) [Rossellomorea sp. AcN35-11]|nr:hypothetical protein [Rossellomorea aquimaris]WJV31865.1 hypothetical protein QTG56_24850 [Rossellomorea sp. AcN35-11]